MYLDALGAQRIPDPTTAGDLCKRAGFKRVLLRGDTDFTQTKHPDGWHGAGVRFIFGIEAMPNLVDLAESLENKAWKPLRRDAKYTVKTRPRQRPVNVKESIVPERGFENIRLQSEEVAEFDMALHTGQGRHVHPLNLCHAATNACSRWIDWCSVTGHLMGVAWDAR